MEEWGIDLILCLPQCLPGQVLETPPWVIDGRLNSHKTVQRAHQNERKTTAAKEEKGSNRKKKRHSYNHEDTLAAVQRASAYMFSTK